jgi:hypothetical protein
VEWYLILVAVVATSEEASSPRSFAGDQGKEMKRSSPYYNC